MWYYAEHGVRVGPLDSAQLAMQVVEGSLSPRALVWKDGMEAWVPFSDLEELRKVQKQMQAGPDAARLPINIPSAVQEEPDATPFLIAESGLQYVCCECEESHSADFIVKLGGRWVCGYCKPSYLQKLEEKVYERRILNYAGFSTRYLVGISEFNGSIVIIAFLIGFLGLSELFHHHPLTPSKPKSLEHTFFIINCFTLLIRTPYEIFALTVFGCTFMQNRFGLKVVKSDGSPITLLRSFFRTLVTSCCYGVIWAQTDYQLLATALIVGLAGLVDRQKRAIGDYLCGTRVIYVRK